MYVFMHACMYACMHACIRMLANLNRQIYRYVFNVYVCPCLQEPEKGPRQRLSRVEKIQRMCHCGVMFACGSRFQGVGFILNPKPYRVQG